MAWPPATLPTSYTNSTPQNTTHPAIHNTANAAINDTVGQLVIISAGVANNVLTALGAPSVAAGVNQAIAYTSLSSGAWGAGPTLIAPSGTTGVFAVMVNISASPTMGVSDFADITLTIGAVTYTAYIVPGKQKICFTAISGIGAGDQVGVAAFNPTASPGNFNTRLVIAKVSM